MTFVRLLLCYSILYISGNVFGADPVVVFQDDFSDVKGFSSVNTNGSYEDSFEDRTRDAHTYMGSKIGGGYLEITVKEDSTSTGPDRKAGVLALSFNHVPETADYCGFLYRGRADAPILISQLRGTVKPSDLERVRVSFRYRASNPKKEHAGAVLNCRFEVEIEDAFEHRVDFGDLKATTEWQSFSRTLDKGTNTDQFLKAVNGLTAPQFKIVWGQNGEITNYNNGDTIQIDDIRISFAPLP